MKTARYPAGVRELDHTADVGFEIRASSLERLFDRAARGASALLYGAEDGEPVPEEDPGAAAENPSQEGPAPDEPRDDTPPGRSHRQDGQLVERRLSLTAADAAALLVDWLQEVLYILALEGVEYLDSRFDRLEETRLDARIRLRTCGAGPIREVKGVTYHDLTVERQADDWFARVIFDV